MPSSLIRGRHVVTHPGSGTDSSVTIYDGAVFQRDGVIEDVGPYRSLRSKYDADVEIGGPNYIVIPGLVNSHHHGRGVSTLQMGICDECLETWILAGWGRRPFDHYLMTLYTALQMIESGTTTIMYNHGQTPASGLEEDIGEVMRAFQDSGMRVALSVYLRNRNRVVYGDDLVFLSGLPADLADILGKYLAANTVSVADYFTIFANLHRKYGSDPASKSRVLLSPSNVQWNTDDFLQQTKEYAKRYSTGIHMHLVESTYQKEFGVRTWGKTPVAHLNDLAFLGPEVSFAHAIWLTDNDIDLLGSSGATVCHNASSNLRLKNGIAPVNALLSRGVNVAMGTDSTAINDDDDMIQEMRLVKHLQREPGLDLPAITSDQVLGMATANAATPTFFPDQIGVLEKGRQADLVLVDMTAIEQPYLDAAISPIDALVYRGKIRDVDTVMIGGEVVLRRGQFTGINKEEITRRLREQLAAPLEPAVVETREMVQRLMPYIRRFYGDWKLGHGPPHYRYNSRV